MTSKYCRQRPLDAAICNGGSAKMIEDGTGSQHSGQLGPGSGGLGMVTKQQQDDVGQRPQYSMPGILHFLQTEWARFEMERSQWEVERAELQVSKKKSLIFCVIAFSSCSCCLCTSYFCVTT